MPGPRIDDHERALGVVDDHALGRDDAHQRVVGGMLERAGVGNRFVLEFEHRRLAGSLMLQPLVAAAAQRVPVEHRALARIERSMVRWRSAMNLGPPASTKNHVVRAAFQRSSSFLMAPMLPLTTSIKAGTRSSLVLFGSVLIQLTTKQNVTGVALTTICPAYERA